MPDTPSAEVQTMAERSRKTPQEHLAALRQHLQALGTKMSHGLAVDDEDIRMAIFFVDTIGEALPAAPVAVTPTPIEPEVETVRSDGPTLEEYVAAGYRAENYPPEGYAERDSPGLRQLRARQAHDTWVAGGKVGPAPGPAPEPETSHETQPSSDGSQPSGAAETPVTGAATSTGEQSQA